MLQGGRSGRAARRAGAGAPRVRGHIVLAAVGAARAQAGPRMAVAHLAPVRNAFKAGDLLSWAPMYAAGAQAEQQHAQVAGHGCSHQPSAQVGQVVGAVVWGWCCSGNYSHAPVHAHLWAWDQGLLLTD